MASWRAKCAVQLVLRKSGMGSACFNNGATGVKEAGRFCMSAYHEDNPIIEIIARVLKCSPKRDIPRKLSCPCHRKALPEFCKVALLSYTLVFCPTEMMVVGPMLHDQFAFDVSARRACERKAESKNVPDGSICNEIM